MLLHLCFCMFVCSDQTQEFSGSRLEHLLLEHDRVVIFSSFPPLALVVYSPALACAPCNGHSRGLIDAVQAEVSDRSSMLGRDDIRILLPTQGWRGQGAVLLATPEGNGRGSAGVEGVGRAFRPSPFEHARVASTKTCIWAYRTRRDALAGRTPCVRASSVRVRSLTILTKISRLWWFLSMRRGRRLQSKRGTSSIRGDFTISTLRSGDCICKHRAFAVLQRLLLRDSRSFPVDATARRRLDFY